MTQLKAEELIERVQGITNLDTALQVVADNIITKLSSNYEGLERNVEVVDQGGFGLPSSVRSYGVQQVTVHGAPTVKSYLFGAIKRVVPNETRKNLCSVSTDFGLIKRKVVVHVNEKPVVEACEDVVGRTNGVFSLEYSF